MVNRASKTVAQQGGSWFNKDFCSAHFYMAGFPLNHAWVCSNGDHDNVTTDRKVSLFRRKMSHVVRLWHFLSSLTSFFKRACAAWLDVWFLVRPFVYFHTSCVRTAKALARLRGCAGSPEPSLVAYVLRTIIHELSHFCVAALSELRLWYIQDSNLFSSRFFICLLEI